MRFQRIGLIGLGLIGGSIARTIKDRRKELRLFALSRREETVKSAFAQGLIENDTPLALDDFADMDLVILCTPVQENLNYLKALKKICRNDTIITDVGSVKGDIHALVQELDMECRFIGGHPMAGSEKTGLENATAHLLENAYYVLTPTAQTSKEDIDEMVAFVKLLGAIPLLMDAQRHDNAVAAISHLPHMISYALVDMVREIDRDGTMKTIAAGGFRDMTRIAASSPDMWTSICSSNRTVISAMIDRYIETLQGIQNQIDKGQSEPLRRLFEDAKEYRDSLNMHASGVLEQAHELYIDLIDEAGGIATVATILSSNHLSIKNIGIIHNREFSEGVLRLEMYDGEALETAAALLEKHHYKLYRR